MKNETILALTLLACLSGVLIGRALPRDPAGGTAVAVRSVPSVTVHPSRLAGCSAERVELAQMKAELARCATLAPSVSSGNFRDATAADAQVDPAVETEMDTQDDHAARDAARVRRNIDALNTPGELIIVRHSDHSIGIYPEGQHVEGATIVARRLPSGEIGWYDPDAGLRTDPSAFRPASPGSPRALPKVEVGPDGLLYVNGELADPAIQRMFPPPGR